MRPRRRPEDRRIPQPQDRINENIRVPQVRLVGEDGEQIGIKSTDEAREYAYSKGLDLVEVAAGADPPVARVMDYGKYRYEQEQKAKLARKHQIQINIKEIKLRPKIGIHDYNTKKGHAWRCRKRTDRVGAPDVVLAEDRGRARRSAGAEGASRVRRRRPFHCQLRD